MNRPAPIGLPARRCALRIRSRQRGATLLEGLGALLIAAMMFVGFSALVNTSMKDLRDQQAAQYQSQLAGAAAQLVQANYATLASSATAATPTVVPLHASSGGLQLASYLPASVQGQNAYGQAPCLLVFAPATGGLDALLVTEGGQVIPDVELGFIAANAGTGGGSLPLHQPGATTPNSAAYGAYGSWIINTPNPSGASCSGTPTGAGHLVSEAYTSAPTNQNSDFLYRVGVPGYADANAMHVPIYMADQTHTAGQSDSACGPSVVPNSTGKITADTNGQVLSCSSGGYWQGAGSLYWRDPVANQADLPTGASAVVGDVALALDTGIPYKYTGSTWHSLIVDNYGNLNIGTGALVGGQVVMTTSNTAGSPCDNGASLASRVGVGGVGQLSVDSSGNMLSCVNGTWQEQVRIDSATSIAGCLVIMQVPSAPSGCQVYSGPYPNGTTILSTGGNGYTYTQQWQVTLTRPGIITASVWGHMAETYCGQTGYSGQIQQQVSFIDNDTNSSVGSNWSQSPALNDTTGSVTVSLTLPLTPNNKGYSVQIITAWETYGGQTTPYAAALCDTTSGSATPAPVPSLMTGWNVNSIY